MSDENMVGRKKQSTTIVLFLFFCHRFYLNGPGNGLLFLLTGGGFIVWAIMDMIKILNGTMTDKNGNTLV